MPRSMTGFARLETKHPWGTLVWELRSVNHRYLEPHFRLPETLRALEPDLRDLIRSNLQRGKLEATLNLQRTFAPGEKIGINNDLARQIANAAAQIDKLLTDTTPVCALEILRWPGVMQEQEIDMDTLHKAATTLFNETLQQLVQIREREGKELRHFIEQRLQKVSAQVLVVRQQMPTILQAQRDKLLTRLEAIKDELDNTRLEQELVYLAQKADVDEELDRLDTHVAEVGRTLKLKGAIGRRLDFLMQELNREANTLSSKSSVSDTTQVAVELKVLIEQMREQVQNIE